MPTLDATDRAAKLLDGTMKEKKKKEKRNSFSSLDAILSRNSLVRGGEPQKSILIQNV